jgi:hypothetical protein
VRDAFQVHLVNKRADAVRYRVEVDPSPGMTSVVPLPVVSVAPLGDARVPVFVTVGRPDFRAEFPVVVRVVPEARAVSATTLTGTFLGPRS